jgi:hypothetical protein
MEAVEAASHRPKYQTASYRVPWRGVVVITTSWHQNLVTVMLHNQVNQLSQLEQ